MKILIFIYALNKIGGIETFVTNFCKRIKEDITVIYETGDDERISLLSKYAKVEKMSNSQYETDICIYATAWGNRPEDKIKAKRYIQVVHADYRNVIKNWKGQSLNITPKTTDVVSVGENVKESIKQLYNIDSTVIYNLLDIDNKPKNRSRISPKTLKLITASRISPEKGFERMELMAQKLTDSGKEFIWDVYGDTTYVPYKSKVLEMFRQYPQVKFKGSVIDIASKLKNYDYLVQLSDTEGFAYSVYESLQAGTPCIVTNFQSATEQITEGKNGYVLDMELSNLDIEKLYKKIPCEIKFNEKSTEKDWYSLFNREPEYISVKVIKKYKDLQLNKIMQENEEIKVTKTRLNSIKEFVEVIK